MENAGRSCAEIVSRILGDLEGKKVGILCGTGNNGGDGFVIARHLHNAGIDVMIIICGSGDKIKGDAKINYDLARVLKLEIAEFESIAPPFLREISELASSCDVLVDAIFGIGLCGELRDEYQGLIEAINLLGKPIIAVDIPSGLDCDTGKPLPISIIAYATVTFIAAKTGFANADSARHTGDVYIASIGIEPVDKTCA